MTVTEPKASTALSLRKRQDRWQALRHHGYGQGNGEQHHLPKAPDSFDNRTANGEQQPECQNGERHLITELPEPLFERRLARLNAADDGSEAPHRAVGTCTRYLDVALAAHKQGATQELSP